MEIFEHFESNLRYFGEWLKQLFGESEGKGGKGAYPTALCFSTDLHSIGQFLQQGNQMFYETLICIEKSNYDFVIPESAGYPYAGKTLEALCHAVGLTYRGTLPVAMPENYIAMFNVPSAEKCRKIIQQARPVLEKGSEYILQGKSFPAEKVSAVDKLKSGPVNQGFYAYFVNAKQFHTTDNCIGCGKCVELCPLNNIHLTAGKPVWGNHCTHCMACICDCPSEAIEYGKHSIGKTRYRCEDYLK
jgi:ferredoxin